MLTADFASAAVLITMGALLGKTSPLQLIVVCFLEIVLFALNEWIGLSLLQVGALALLLLISSHSMLWTFYFFL